MLQGLRYPLAVKILALAEVVEWTRRRRYTCL
jgi:hypothetical protein